MFACVCVRARVRACVCVCVRDTVCECFMCTDSTMSGSGQRSPEILIQSSVPPADAEVRIAFDGPTKAYQPQALVLYDRSAVAPKHGSEKNWDASAIQSEADRGIGDDFGLSTASVVPAH
jgi:hypothetical protein